ncbi:MAG: prepilin peptidase [Thermoplasmatota archaeon]
MDDALPRVLAALAMLAGAAVLDWRSRRVANLYWLPFLATAGILWAGDLLRHGPAEVWPWLAGALAACAVFYGMWWTGLFFGGGDAKALMVVALLAPYPAAGGLYPVADALVNGLLVNLLLPLAILVVNLARGRWAGAATFLAVPMPLAAARRAKVWPAQVVDDEGAIRWRLLQRLDQDTEQAYVALRRAGVDPVWVTPQVPFVIPLTLGLAASLWWGNLAMRLAAWLLPL